MFNELELINNNLDIVISQLNNFDQFASNFSSPNYIYTSLPEINSIVISAEKDISSIEDMIYTGEGIPQPTFDPSKEDELSRAEIGVVLNNYYETMNNMYFESVD